MSVRKQDNPALYKRIEEQNLLRQYDLLYNCIEIGLEKGIESFDKYTLWALNYIAVANIAQFGGRYREDPISVGDHITPHFREVPNLVDRMISIVHENWTIVKGPTSLAAFVLWRMNWIHPFVEGNGRTARAACYYLICMKHKRLLPGTKIVPERIRENRQPYYDALRAADEKWAEGKLDVRVMSAYLAGLLKGQLAEEVNNLSGQALDKIPPIQTP